GRGLARGYWNLKEETDRQFVSDPFHPGERMYRTGDLVKWTEDGELIYLGRIDHQVKIRGFRIELSEIEAQLMALDSVKEAAVTTTFDAHGQAALAAYVVSNEASEALKEALKRTLPAYMVPSFMIQLEALPVTANGKVDKKALPAPDVEASKTTYEAPRDEMESLLCDIWADVLGLEQVGIHDNFFFLGGDSIKGIQMASRLTQNGWKLEMKQLFQYPTIADIRPYIEVADVAIADQSPVEGEVILTPIQRWFFERKFTNQHHWNLSMMLHAPNGFDPDVTKKVIQKLVEHHDALRMVYRQENEELVQFNLRTLEDQVSIVSYDMKEEQDVRTAISQYANELQRQLCLEKGQLMKVARFETFDGDHLLIVTHHLVIDGVSCRILLEDFVTLYKQVEQGHDMILPQKTHSFKEWADALALYAQSKQLKSQQAYWEAIEQVQIEALPVDFEAKMKTIAQTQAVQFVLTEDQTQHLLTDIHHPYTTEINDILLCALGLAIGKWAKRDRILVQLEGHGRENILSGLDVSRTIGWFTSMYPIVLNTEQNEDLSEAIKATKEMLRRVPDKGVGYGILRYMTETPETDKSYMQSEISFNYLGQIDNDVTTDFFGPSSFDMGRQASSESEALYKLNFSGLVKQNQFILSCSYSQVEYEEETIRQLMNLIKEELLALTKHCLAQKERAFTPSDFSAGDLEMEEMSDIFDMLEENLK
ncbi:condensation domain-containing protein, partial [Bacillus sp. NPDC077027]|uniref:condensation domain-containing protein n=1 Tax=Bacillus sp. NPDC077027 TaxID=3390548 RepID=UPI003CFEBB3D